MPNYPLRRSEAMNKLLDWFSPSLVCLAALTITALAHGQPGT